MQDRKKAAVQATGRGIKVADKPLTQVPLHILKKVARHLGRGGNQRHESGRKTSR